MKITKFYRGVFEIRLYIEPFVSFVRFVVRKNSIARRDDANQPRLS